MGSRQLRILFLVMTTDVCGLADDTCGDHGIKRAGVIFHIEPVCGSGHPCRTPAAVLPSKCVEDHQRDQLLGEVVRAVVVGAVGDDGRSEAVSTTPGAPDGRRALGGRNGAAGGKG